MPDRVWEVFRQEAEGDPLVHGGSVNAPDEELALHYAREFYGRRQESVRLWVVPRDVDRRARGSRTCSSLRSTARSSVPAGT